MDSASTSTPSDAPTGSPRVILSGPDRGLTAAFTDAGATVVHLEGMVTADRLAEADVGTAELFVLTDPDEATAIPLAREANPDVRIVGYAGESFPEFALAGLELVLDPALYEPSVVAEELLDGAGE